MVIKRILCAALAIAGLMICAEVNAQGSQSTTRWKGNDYATLLQSGETEVFLYNVGTGRFLIHGGDWGTQARLFYEDTGKLLTICYGRSGSNIVFKTGMSTAQTGFPGNFLGCNVPAVTCFSDNSHNPTKWDDGNTFNILMDAHEDYRENSGTPYRNWELIQVTDDDENGNYTYYMCETLRGRTATADSVVYMGAAYGENFGDNEGDPNGKLVLLSSSFDKAVWSAVDPRSTTDYLCGVKNAEKEGLPTGTTRVMRSMDDEVPIFNVDTKVKLKKLYQWRIVTKAEVLARLATGDIGDGLSTNLTYLINDRGFERNDWSFFNTTNGWVENRFSDGSYSTTGRYKYTWGYTGEETATGGSKTQHKTNSTVDEPWNRPLRLKTQWDSKEEAKYGYMLFEGLGTVSTGIKVSSANTADPKLAPGVYKVSCYGFYQNGGNDDHPAFFFVSTKAPNQLSVNESESNVFKRIALKNVSGFDKGYTNSTNNRDGGYTIHTATGSKDSNGNPILYTSNVGVKGAGHDFVYDKDSYYVELEITVEEGQTLYFGLLKDKTAQSSRISSGYYDMDWAGADQFQLYYLGTDDPIMFDEDKFNWDYLPQETDGRARTIRLHRTFKKDKWNSFVFPYDLTAVQVRNAFGNETRVAELDGLGTITDPEKAHDANVIDFKTVSLPAEGTAVTKNKFYLIKPATDPLTTSDGKTYYNMGSVAYVKGDLPTEIEVESYGIGEGALNAVGHNTIISKATYWATTDYDNFNNNNLDAVTNKVYAPAKSYVISDSKMYYIKNANRIKGFRGWIEDVDAPSTTGNAKLALNGIIDENEISGIDDIVTDDALPVLTNGSAIYDLSGRKVAVSVNQLNTLPKGMYIVNGKKYIVK
ncbi:MAG: hypothetical protein IKH91_06015 [Prevotella sp.]|nr:hypothetical protein [Prevotella sp.]